MPAGKRASSAMDGELLAILVTWISAFPAEMTIQRARGVS